MKNQIKQFEVKDGIGSWTFRSNKNYPGLHLAFENNDSILELIQKILIFQYGSENLIKLQIEAIPEWAKEIKPFKYLSLKTVIKADQRSQIKQNENTIEIHLTKTDLETLYNKVKNKDFDKSIVLVNETITFW